MTKIVPFPKSADRNRAARGTEAEAHYEFTQLELEQLCRWYSAMRYAFPGLQGIMAVYRKERTSAIGLFGETGAAPSCLLSKHESGGRTYLVWATQQDAPRIVGSVGEITEAQIDAIEPPRDEASWLDAGGWLDVLANRMVGEIAAEAESAAPPA